MECSKYVVLLEYFLIECESKTCVRLGTHRISEHHGPPLYFATMDFEVPDTPRDPIFETVGTPQFQIPNAYPDIL